MTFLPGTGRHRVQIIYFFRGQIGPWRPLGVDLVMGSHLDRIRHRYGSLVLSGSSGSHCHLPNDLRNRRNLARGGYSSRPVPDLRGQARLRPPFTSFCTAGGDELARRGGATGEGKSLGARRARLNQLKADPLPSARPPPEEIVFGIGRPAPRLRGRAALGPSPISNVDSRAAVDRGATLPPVKKGGRGRLRQVAVDDESLVVSVEGVGSRSGCRGREPELLRGNGRSKTQTGRREASPGAGRRATQRA